jgi:hypothetical protein
MNTKKNNNANNNNNNNKKNNKQETKQVRNNIHYLPIVSLSIVKYANYYFLQALENKSSLNKLINE